MGGETELTKRLEKDGIKSIYLPRSLVYHRIRPEQLNTKWLYRRAFAQGRAEAWYSGRVRVPTLLGVPRYLVRELIEAYAKRTAFFLKKTRSIKMGIEYWRIRGKIYQYKRKYSNKNLDTRIHVKSRP